MEIPTREAILEAGKLLIRVKRSGTLQQQEFLVKKIPSPNGTYFVLHLDNYIDLSELLRIAEEYKIPFSVKNGVVFPKGTSTKDFILP
ncbi:hypothetical protein HY570_04220 [Candidatus Micrarchaeota archaeon]|nr:hypothetical protein [Candidatus Micrarchaeota archaeon]